MFFHPFPPDPPAIVMVQSTVAPHAGAAGTSGAAASSGARSGQTSRGSDNGGQLAGSAVPGGTNKAPAEGKKADSFSAPIAK